MVHFDHFAFDWRHHLDFFTLARKAPCLLALTNPLAGLRQFDLFDGTGERGGEFIDADALNMFALLHAPGMTGVISDFVGNCKTVDDGWGESGHGGPFPGNAWRFASR